MPPVTQPSISDEPSIPTRIDAGSPATAYTLPGTPLVFKIIHDPRQPSLRAECRALHVRGIEAVVGAMGAVFLRSYYDCRVRRQRHGVHRSWCGLSSAALHRQTYRRCGPDMLGPDIHSLADAFFANNLYYVRPIPDDNVSSLLFCVLKGLAWLTASSCAVYRRVCMPNAYWICWATLWLQRICATAFALMIRVGTVCWLVPHTGPAGS